MNDRIRRALNRNTKTDYESAWERYERIINTDKIKDRKTFKEELRRWGGNRYSDSLAEALTRIPSVQRLIGEWDDPYNPAKAPIIPVKVKTHRGLKPFKITVKGKTRQVYRNSKGQFARKPPS